MISDITLVIPTHNRHFYLRRILKFYADYDIKIIVGDSTREPFTDIRSTIPYYHCPHLGLPQKISFLLSKVTTTYVVMCADDDFIIPEAIENCVEYLLLNREYSVAQGKSVYFKKESLLTKQIIFSIIYSEGQVVNDDDEPLKRLQNLFFPYHSLFYGVHYTKNLKDSFRGDIPVKNLFLNEYLTALIPTYLGKTIELSFLYHVREYSAESDDKITTNLFDIIDNLVYANEYNMYLDYVSAILKEKNVGHTVDIGGEIDGILRKYSKYIEHADINTKKVSFRKKVGNLVSLIPSLGKKIILKSRDLERKKKLNGLINTENDKLKLKKISDFLISYYATT